jgi:hypothetical protein
VEKRAGLNDWNDLEANLMVAIQYLVVQRRASRLLYIDVHPRDGLDDM